MTGAAKPRREDRWESITVSRIVKREALAGRLPDGMTLPIDPRPRTRTLTTHVLSGLVRCPHDGSILTTTWRSNREGKSVGLLCRIGRMTSDHPRPYSVGEEAISTGGLATAEVLSRVGMGYQPVVLDADGNVVFGEPEAIDVNARAGALRESRRRLVRVYTSGDISDAEYDRDLADIDRQLDLLANEQRSVNAWHMNLQWDTPEGMTDRVWHADLNVRLRLLHPIRLNDSMRPIGAVWRRRPLARDGSGVFVLEEETGDEVGDFDPRAIAVEAAGLCHRGRGDACAQFGTAGVLQRRDLRPTRKYAYLCPRPHEASGVGVLGPLLRALLLHYLLAFAVEVLSNRRGRGL